MVEFHCVLGNRDFLKVQDERLPIWRFIDHRQWLSSLVYLNHRLQRPPDSTFILDCGAWSYKNEALPRWSVGECIERYATFAQPGDTITSPDHMVLRGMAEEEEALRVDLTLDNARQFLKLCPVEWSPMAVTHGSTITARIAMTKELLDMGYRTIGIGSVAIRAGNRRFVHSLLEETVRLREQEPFRIHVLGISALSWVPVYGELGIDSYDGSSMFFSAFTAGEFLWHDGSGKLREYKVKQVPVNEIPFCGCLPCRSMRAEGLDTREYGSNERNMGRAVHNINQYLAALDMVRGTRLAQPALLGPNYLSPSARADIDACDEFD